MKLKKFFAGLVMVCSLLTVCIPELPVQAAAPDPGSVTEPCKEEKKWFFRIHNGHLQRRLWSITYMKWLTDWITIE